MDMLLITIICNALDLRIVSSQQCRDLPSTELSQNGDGGFLDDVNVCLKRYVLVSQLRQGSGICLARSS